MLNKLIALVRYIRRCIYFRYIPFNRNQRVFLDKNPKIVNPKCILINGTIGCGRNAWIHAVTEYFNYNYNPQIVLGDSFSCGNDFHLAATNRIIVGSNVLVGSYVLITDHAHGIYDDSDFNSSPYTPPMSRKLSASEIIIGDNVWIGDSVKIIGNVNIGSGSVIGAGSIVVKDVPANSIVCGVPAKVIKKWCDSSLKWLK